MMEAEFPGRFTMSEMVSPHSRREFLSASAAVTAGAVTGSFGIFTPCAQAAEMGGDPAGNNTAPSADGAIRPFPVHFPEKDLADLRRRILATRRPDKETVADQSQGT